MDEADGAAVSHPAHQMQPLRRRLFVLISALVLSLVAAALAGSRAAGELRMPRAASLVAFSPVADAHVRSDLARRSFGRSRTLTIDASPKMRAYLAFGPRPPTGAAVARAVLRVYVFRGSAAGFHVRIARGRIQERLLTFANAPRPSVAAVRSGPVSRGWIDVDVTSLARRSGTHTTYVLTTRSRTRLLLAARENSSRKPRLTATTKRPATNPVIAGAGDIAYGGSTDEATAKLLDRIDPVHVFTLGDNAYDRGSSSDYQSWYDPTWGRHKAKTKPSAGNHEYETGGAAGYFGYFGSAAGDPGKGYYSYTVGDWRVFVLNTNADCRVVSCAAGSAQETWLRRELAKTTAKCVLAYMHHPRFSAGTNHGDSPEVKPLWRALYRADADLVLAGHDHNYQRFAPMNPDGAVDRARGIRSFVVGTGGKSPLYGLRTRQGVEAKNAVTHGVLALTLRAKSYDWQFLPIAGKTFTDAGSGACH